MTAFVVMTVFFVAVFFMIVGLVIAAEKHDDDWDDYD